MRCGKGQGDNLARIGVKAEAAAVYMVRWYENNVNTLFGTATDVFIVRLKNRLGRGDGNLCQLSADWFEPGA